MPTIPSTVDQVIAILMKWGEYVLSPVYKTAYNAVISTAILYLVVAAVLLVVSIACTIIFRKAWKAGANKCNTSTEDNIEMITAIIGIASFLVGICFLYYGVKYLIMPDWIALQSVADLIFNNAK
jgi:hypothetical protein